MVILPIFMQQKYLSPWNLIREQPYWFGVYPLRANKKLARDVIETSATPTDFVLDVTH